MVYNYVLSGWGKVGNVTGGTGGTTHEFTDIETMRLFCLDNPSASMILIYTGSDFSYSVNQNYPWSTEGNPISNKTIYASLGQKILNGQWEFSGATNFIVRNFKRAISFNDLFQWRFATRIWIDHCELDGEATSANDYSIGTTADGCCDMTKESDLITISNTLFLNGGSKTMLTGASNLDVTDIGKLRVTLDRCLFYKCRGRTPFVRYSELFHKINVVHDWDLTPTFPTNMQEIAIQARVLNTKCFWKRGRWVIRDYDYNAAEKLSGVKSIDCTTGTLSAGANHSSGEFLIDDNVRHENVDFDFATEPTYTWNALDTTAELEQWLSEWGGAKYHLISAPTTYTLTLTTTAGGSAISDPASGTIESGSTVILTATPATGFNFSRWENVLTGQTLSGSETYNHVMLDDISIVAVFVSDVPVDPGDAIRFCRIDN